MPEQQKNRYKKDYGDSGEQLAKVALKEQGYVILEQNFRCRQGEVDLIAQEGKYLCFIEVKKRRNLQSGFPQEAVTPTKIRHICRTALYYLSIHRLPESTPVRFDVVVIVDEKVEIIRNAFSYTI